jgi:hypothetical protein
MVVVLEVVSAPTVRMAVPVPLLPMLMFCVTKPLVEPICVVFDTAVVAILIVPPVPDCMPTALAPVPPLIVTPEAPVLLPIVVLWAKAPVPMLIVGVPLDEVPLSMLILPAVPAEALPLVIVIAPVAVVPVPVLSARAPEVPAEALPD